MFRARLTTPAAGLALAAAAWLAGSCGPTARPGEPPQHVFLVTVSGLRADHLSSWMYPRPTTLSEPPPPPGAADLSVDGLAASGVRFARAFAPRADSAAGLAELLTGLHDPAPDAPSIVAAFREQGFRCAAFLTGAAAEAEHLGRGFDLVFRPDAGQEDADYRAVQGAATWLKTEGEPSGERLFLWLHLSGPAAPWTPAPLRDKDFAARFTDPDYSGAIDGGQATLDALRDPDTELSGLDLTHLVALYDAEVARTAYLVRQLAATFEGRFDLLPRDLLSDAVVVFAGDRGCELFQHGRAAEDPESLYDASLHVPLLLRHPRSLTGSRVLGELVELADVAPTLLDWFGLEPEAARGLDGRSLLPLTDSYVERPFDSRPLVRRRAARASVRTERWHLLVDGDAARLFDVQADPLERHDRAGSHPAVVAELRAVLGAP